MSAVLMVQGTASSVGKSLLVTALCRLFARAGVRVAPFKAQNMALNSAVTPDGLEIGRAQAVQAEAAGVAARVEMNPVLIKPEGPSRAQIVVEGRPWRSLEAVDFYARKAALWKVVTRNLDALRNEFELIIIEGAGSPAEINLRAGDIVNMRVARYAHAPVLLAGDIDRGGVFAAMLGTLLLLEPGERQLVQGLLINRFRGDIALLNPGLAMLEERAGVPVLGVVPYISDLRIAQEDGVWLDEQQAQPASGGLDIAIIRLPQIANFDEFNDLADEPGVRVRYVKELAELGWPDAVIVPGTKNTIGSRRFLRESRLDRAIVGLAAAGRAIVGICGGYQLLGRSIVDPQGIDGEGGVEQGLGLLPAETIFQPAKTTCLVEADLAQPLWGMPAAPHHLRGYEIHMGETRLAPGTRPLLRVNRRTGPTTQSDDGAAINGGRVIGTYLHGLFENRVLRRAWLRNLGWRETSRAELDRFAEYDRLADTLAASLDLERLFAIAGVRPARR